MALLLFVYVDMHLHTEMCGYLYMYIYICVYTHRGMHACRHADIVRCYIATPVLCFGFATLPMKHYG